MAISGTYFIKMWLPDPKLVHGPDFQGGPPAGGPPPEGMPEGGPGRWEVWARVDQDGYIEGMISVGGNKGFPNFVYGKKLD